MDKETLKTIKAAGVAEREIWTFSYFLICKLKADNMTDTFIKCNEGKRCKLMAKYSANVAQKTKNLIELMENIPETKQAFLNDIKAELMGHDVYT